MIAIAVAFAFRLNRVAVLAGAWINAWALAPCYAFGTFIGALILGVDTGDLQAIDWSQGIEALTSTLGTLFWPILLGNTVLAAVVAVPAYGLSRKFLESRNQRKAEAGPDPEPKTPGE